MRRMNWLSMKWALLSVAPLAVLPIGCGGTFPPPAEAILAGTWALTTPSTVALTQLLLTFDGNGDLTTVTYEVGGGITITDSSPSSTTRVDGKSVTISTEFFGNTLAFEGTLNDTDTVIDGSFTTRIAMGSIVITIDNGPGTLTKQ
jgi:hypothetical protein